MVHEKRDFFKRINDRVFARAVDVVIDNPPYTGKGMKERVLRALVDADVPFCLLLPLGVLHGAFVREALEVGKVQALVPRRCWVSKKARGRCRSSISCGCATASSSSATWCSCRTRDARCRRGTEETVVRWRYPM